MPSFTKLLVATLKVVMCRLLLSLQPCRYVSYMYHTVYKLLSFEQDLFALSAKQGSQVSFVQQTIRESGLFFFRISYDC